MNIKSTILACVTFLVGIAIVITYVGQQDRYAIFSQDKAIFVFDRKNATLNYCTADNCQLITPNAGTPEMAAAMSGLPSQMAVINGQPVMVQASPMMPQQQAIVNPQISSLQNVPVMMPAGMQPMMMAAPAAPIVAKTSKAAPVAAPSDEDDQSTSSSDDSSDTSAE